MFGCFLSRVFSKETSKFRNILKRKYYLAVYVFQHLQLGATQKAVYFYVSRSFWTTHNTAEIISGNGPWMVPKPWAMAGPSAEIIHLLPYADPKADPNADPQLILLPLSSCWALR